MKNYIVKNWGLLLVLLVLLSVCVVNCTNESLSKKDTSTYTTVSSKKEALKTIYVHDTIVKKFHEIKTITKVEQQIKIDTVTIVFRDTIPCDFSRSGRVITKEYDLGYKINNSYLKVCNLKIKDSLLIVTGTKRKWFLGEETNTIDISHSNKYFYDSNIKHVEVKTSKKFYETRLFSLGIGVLIGVSLK